METLEQWSNKIIDLFICKYTATIGLFLGKKDPYNRTIETVDLVIWKYTRAKEQQVYSCTETIDSFITIDSIFSKQLF